ncbi:hypothetical protein MIR68_005565 [Amoeboaphelidium protococcarum]|nr:hypothetical protein MIR68_005565 [Amoeboaphelidium protococcarum]
MKEFIMGLVTLLITLNQIQAQDLINGQTKTCMIVNEQFNHIAHGEAQLSFECKQSPQQCRMSFLIKDDASFYCDMSDCAALDGSRSAGESTVSSRCDKVKCNCIAGKSLCDTDRGLGLDLQPIFDELVRGPANLTCGAFKNGYVDYNCEFSEPAFSEILEAISPDNPVFELACEDVPSLDPVSGGIKFNNGARFLHQRP